MPRTAVAVGLLLCGLAGQGAASADAGGVGHVGSVLRGAGTMTNMSRRLAVERTTWNNCKCKQEWSMDTIGTCKHSCCNLDNDTLGDWCMVEDEKCEESDWGYCKPQGLGSTTCRDSPTAWVDVEGDRCADYAQMEYCTAKGDYGNKWDKSWGSFYDFANQGHTALTACCSCGGGIDATNQCKDKKDWTDADGDDCAAYLAKSWCDITGAYGVGWHEEWGTFADAFNKGMTALQACCACGGGEYVGAARPESAGSHVQVRSTIIGCECKKDWIDEVTGKPCHDSCCNTDGDPNGNWCYVKDVKCEESDFGYCRLSGPRDKPCMDSPPAWVDAEGDACYDYEEKNMCTAWGGYGSGWKADWGTFDQYWNDGHSAITACCACGGGGERGRLGNFNRECQDKQGWNDTDGDSCAAYADDNWCTSTGGYGWGWHQEWGTFADHGKHQMSAPQACCACGGGSSTNFKAHPSAQGLTLSPNASAASPPTPSVSGGAGRKTWNDCECKKTWKEGELSCDNYCCNPDDDEFGFWCLVKDESCEESTWGYCQPDQGNAQHGACSDLWGWTDAEGDGCAAYSDGWCKSDGTPGAKWDSSWGVFADYFSEGHTASTACCICGGGSRPTGTAAAHVCTDVPSWKDPDGDGCSEYAAHMWCSSTGGFGIGWHEEWGNFRGEPTAAKACCYCGGGSGVAGSTPMLASARPAKPPPATKGSSAGAVVGLVAAIIAIIAACLVGAYVYKTKQDLTGDMSKVGATKVGRKYETVGEDL